MNDSLNPELTKEPEAIPCADFTEFLLRLHTSQAIQTSLRPLIAQEQNKAASLITRPGLVKPPQAVDPFSLLITMLSEIAKAQAVLCNAVLLLQGKAPSLAMGDNPMQMHTVPFQYHPPDSTIHSSDSGMNGGAPKEP